MVKLVCTLSTCVGRRVNLWYSIDLETRLSTLNTRNMEITNMLHKKVKLVTTPSIVEIVVNFVASMP